MNFKIPLLAIIVYWLLLIAIKFWVIPNPLVFVELVKNLDTNTLFLIMFVIILLESIVFLWFYLPGQFIAVLLVVSSATWISDVFWLTLVSILAVTLWAFINYYLWYFLCKNRSEKTQKLSYKTLLLSMIHITTLALYIFDRWCKKSSSKIIYLTGLLNFPYYLLIIGITYYFKNEIMTLSENPYIIFVLLFAWLAYSLFTTKKLKNA